MSQSVEGPRPGRPTLLWGVTIVLGGAVLSFGGLVAAGVLEIRRVHPPAAVSERAEDPASPPAAPPARVTDVTDRAPLMPFVDWQGPCFRYEGAFVRCWIEVE